MVEPRHSYLKRAWSDMNLPSTKSISKWDTGCNAELLRFIGNRSVSYPENFVQNLTFSLIKNNL